jgi:hypothetical protein
MANLLEENLKSFLLADDTVKGIVGSRVAYNHLPQASDVPYVWFQQSGSIDDDGIGDAAGAPTRFQYDVECWSERPFQAKQLSSRVQAILNKYRGTFGDTTVQAIFAPSQNDQYVPKAVPADEGFHGSFLSLEIVP